MPIPDHFFAGAPAPRPSGNVDNIVSQIQAIQLEAMAREQQSEQLRRNEEAAGEINRLRRLAANRHEREQIVPAIPAIEEPITEEELYVRIKEDITGYVKTRNFFTLRSNISDKGLMHILELQVTAARELGFEISFEQVQPEQGEWVVHQGRHNIINVYFVTLKKVPEGRNAWEL